MKVKVESVSKGTFGYDSIAVTIDKKKTEIVFDAKDGIEKYEGKFIELVNSNGIYEIKEIKTEK